jgi:cohesin loading factor subunit SCC2
MILGSMQVFDVYPQHRTGIIEEIVSLLWKLPSSKRSLRSYHLPDEESKQIQMLTALILQIVQCSVDLGEGGVDSKPDVAGADVKVAGAAVEATAPVRFFEPAMDTTSYFWKHVLHRWAAPKAQDGADVRAIVENLVLDLLTTLNVPEFPAASLLLQVFVTSGTPSLAVFLFLCT